MSGSLWKKTLIVFIAAAALVAAGYVYRSDLKPLVEKVGDAIGVTPNCSRPVIYSLGTFDTRFGISKSQFLLDVAAAGQVWSDAAKKPLFTFADSGGMKINLIYDYRQQATAEMQSLGITIKDDQSTYDTLKAKYNSLVAQYNSLKATLDQQYAAYQTAKNDYEQQVNYWNSQGGVPKDKYAALEAERQNVNNLAAQVNTTQSTLNTVVGQINSAATILNRLASELNLNVKNYNTIGASTGTEFDEGEFVRDVNGERIDIYQFENNDKLVRVLAHEMGHALGLEHVSDPKAIMYYLNQGTNERPDAADIAELKSVCGLK